MVSPSLVCLGRMNFLPARPGFFFAITQPHEPLDQFATGVGDSIDCIDNRLIAGGAPDFLNEIKEGFRKLINSVFGLQPEISSQLRAGFLESAGNQLLCGGSCRYLFFGDVFFHFGSWFSGQPAKEKAPGLTPFGLALVRYGRSLPGPDPARRGRCPPAMPIKSTLRLERMQESLCRRNS